MSFTLLYNNGQVTGIQGTPGAVVTIPSINPTDSMYSITSIAAGVFEGQQTITQIILPSTINTIGNSAFRACTSLTSINLQDTSISTVPPTAFEYCSSLTTVTLPATVGGIGQRAFADSGLTTLIFLGNAPSIGGSSASGSPFAGISATAYRKSTATGWGSTLGISSATVNVQIIGTPSVPQSIVLSNINSTTVNIAFTAPATTGDIPIINYSVVNVSTDAVVASGTSSPISIINLTPNTLYTFIIYATNAGGNGTPSASYSITTMADLGSSGSVPCFFGNAPVLTHGGYVRIDNIKEGDSVITPEGKEVIVERVKCYRVAANTKTNPYIIPKGQFGATRQLLISPDHRVVTSNGLVEAKRLGLQQKRCEGTLTYYNLQLAGSANMVVAGVPVESLAPIERIIVSRPTFERLLVSKYGAITNSEIVQMIARTCRFLDSNRVEIPVLRKV